MSRSRLATAVFAALLVSGVGARASAQTTAPKKAKTPTATAVKPRANSTTSRFRSAPKSPLAALEARGANPTGPFARLNETQRDSIIENSRSLLGVKYKWAGETPER